MRYQNEFTGDLSMLATVASFVGRDGSNWIKGRLLDQKLDVSFEMKVFKERSPYGIDFGRVNKLLAYEGKESLLAWHTCLINFDRGWDVEPHSPKSAKVLDLFLDAVDGPQEENDA